MLRALVFVLLVASSRHGAAVGCGLDFALTTRTPEGRQAAVAALRRLGPIGLKRALQQFDALQAEVDAAEDSETAGQLQEKLQICRAAVDLIAGQHLATQARLFWHTDFQLAQQRAEAAGKPILSLRLLGKLTDEYSCANSRFFRTALYANQEIGDLLREHFVLHWQTVRPVPKVTIDFGDGRRLERTVTGNSAHYALLATGQPLDVLPGLYSPQQFLAWLQRVDDLAERCHAATDLEEPDGRSKTALLNNYHAGRARAIRQAWIDDIAKVAPSLLKNSGIKTGQSDRSPIQADQQGLAFVDAIQAADRARAKMKPELPILRALRVSPQETDGLVPTQLWQRLAALHRAEVGLDSRSVAAIRQLRPNAFLAGAVSPTKSLVEDPILRLVNRFEEEIALDTVRNEYLLHNQIHRWFLDGNTPVGDLHALNERVYAELFLTPSSDPWLGLVPPDTFTALENNGMRTETPAAR